MYNILVTDDEQIVVDALVFIMNRNFQGQVNLFSAQNGTDAINICAENDIDIVFMDIKMPGMSGLEAMKYILEIKPQALIIILSAFDTFQFAQEALNLGAFKYITKPVNRNLVVEMVRAAMNLVDSRKSIAPDGNELQKKLEKISPVLENDFFYNCVFNHSRNEDVYTYLDYFNIREECFCVACFEFPEMNIKNQNEIHSKIREVFHSQAKCLVSVLLVNRVVVCFYFDKPEGKDSDLWIKDVIKNIYTILGMKVARGIRGGASKSFYEITQIPEKYDFALNALNSASAKGELVFSDESRNPFSKNEAESEKYVARLFNRLKIGDSGTVSYLANSYIGLLRSQGRNLDYIKGKIFEIIVNARNVLREISPKNKVAFPQESFSAISDAQTDSALASYFVSRLEEVAKSVHSLKVQKENPIVQRVIDFLNENMAKNISLETASGIAGVNPFYLSKLFREETGYTFVSYLSERRMDKAKQLLLETDLSIKEITAEIGYNDQNYFSKLFKTKFGISPTDYRKTK